MSDAVTLSVPSKSTRSMAYRPGGTCVHPVAARRNAQAKASHEIVYFCNGGRKMAQIRAPNTFCFLESGSESPHAVMLRIRHGTITQRGQTRRSLDHRGRRIGGGRVKTRK